MKCKSTHILETSYNFLCQLFFFREGKVKLNIDLLPGEEEEPFKPNIINSTVFIICLSLQVLTFAVNYKVQ